MPLDPATSSATLKELQSATLKELQSATLKELQSAHTNGVLV
jgi:hypothetical protein